MESIKSEQQATGSGGRPPRAESEQITPRILEAASAMFLTDGFEKTSMDAVAGKAGVSKRTLYARFTNKAQLFEAAAISVLDRHLHNLDSIEGLSGPLQEMLYDFAIKLLTLALTPQVNDLERVIIGEARQFPEIAARFHRRTVEKIIAALCILFEDAHLSTPGEQMKRDAEIFLSMTVVPATRKAIVFRAKADVADIDEAFLRRAIEIFIAGTRRGRCPQGYDAR